MSMSTQFASLSVGKRRVVSRLVGKSLREDHGYTDDQIAAMKADVDEHGVSRFDSYVQQLFDQRVLVGGEDETIALASKPDDPSAVEQPGEATETTEAIEATETPAAAPSLDDGPAGPVETAASEAVEADTASPAPAAGWAPAASETIGTRAVSTVRRAVVSAVNGVADKMLRHVLVSIRDDVDAAVAEWACGEIEHVAELATTAVELAAASPSRTVLEIRLGRLAGLMIRYRDLMEAAGVPTREAAETADAFFTDLMSKARERYGAVARPK